MTINRNMDWMLGNLVEVLNDKDLGLVTRQMLSGASVPEAIGELNARREIRTARRELRSELMAEMGFAEPSNVKASFSEASDEERDRRLQVTRAAKGWTKAPAKKVVSKAQTAEEALAAHAAALRAGERLLAELSELF